MSEINPTNAVQESERTSAVQESDRTSALQESDRTSAVQESERTSAVQESDRTSAVQESERTSAVQESERTSAVQESERTSAVQESDRTSAVQEPDRTSAVQESEMTSAVKESDRTSAVQESDRTIAVQESDRTIGEHVNGSFEDPSLDKTTPGNISGEQTKGKTIMEDVQSKTDLSANNTRNVQFLSELRFSPDYRMRFIHTVFVVWTFITLGWVVAIQGATFPDLRLIIDKDLDTASWLFTSGNCGYLFGALVGGIIFDRMNRLLLLVCVVCVNAATITVLPFLSTFPLMLAGFFVNGLSTGGIDVSGNSHIASIWGQRAAPFIQSIHFGFSVGGTISPLTAETFVAVKTCVLATTNETIQLLNTTMYNTTEETSGCKEVYGDTSVQYAYIIAGSAAITAAIPFMALYCLSAKYNIYVTAPIEVISSFEEKPENDQRINAMPDLSLCKKILFVTLLMLMLSSYAGGEGRFSGLLTTFVSDYLHMPKSDGLHLASLFWSTFAAGRFLGIIVTKFLRTRNMLLVYQLTLIATFVTFLFASIYEVRELIWACTAIAGLGMSVIFPAIFTWTAESILTVTGTISAVYITGVSVFNMLGPLLYGYLMDNFSQLYFAYLCLGQFVLCMGLYVIIRILISMYIRPQEYKCTI